MHSQLQMSHSSALTDVKKHINLVPHPPLDKHTYTQAHIHTCSLQVHHPHCQLEGEGVLAGRRQKGRV